ncbi:hypothetical protein ACGFYV_09100 [Streptomyces sp. NPDC048297]|uniref:hypothetical protein n=1 Tax=Streptomyces sp. NPDC048297 TaxID=3365531 RepID=UPI00371B1858
MHLPSRLAQVLAVAALPLALTACSTASSGASGSSGSSGSDAPAKTTKAQDANAGLMTGSQLKKALAPASFFPSGLTAVADGAADSGGQFLAPSGRSAAKPDCGKFENTSWIDVTGYKGGVSFAQSDYGNSDRTEEMVQEIDEFQGTTATAVMKEVRDAATACASFTDTEAHAKVRLAGSDTPGLGDEAYTITLTSGSWENGTTLVAARVGTSVVTVMSTAGSDNGATSGGKLASHVVTSLKEAAGAS